MSRNASRDFNNPNLFEENQPGSYQYGTTAHGKSASGQLQIAEHPERDARAQAQAGGAERRATDDGGHAIGARFGGSPRNENLTAQDRNLNRGDYKHMENDWEKSLAAGDRVFVNVESYSHDNSARPSNYMGYYITEHTNENGEVSRDMNYISMNNESRAEQASWDRALDEFHAENPDVVEAERSMNTAMEFQYDEETDTISANPYYDAGDNAAQDSSGSSSAGSSAGSSGGSSGGASNSYDDEDCDADS